MKVFFEEQKFSRWLLLIVMVVPIVSGIIPIILAENEIQGFERDHLSGLIITGGIIILVFIVLLLVKLTTKIDELGVHYQYYPRQFKTQFISWSEIATIDLKKNKKFALNKKYGYKKCFIGKKGISINLGGKHRFTMDLKNGRRIEIGTHKPSELERTLATYNYKLRKNENE